jgi:integrase
LADVIRKYLDDAKSYKRSYRDDARYGRVWTERFAGRTLEEITPGEIEKIRTERLATVKASTVNREVGFLKHVFNVAIRDGKTERNPVAKIRMLKEPSGRVRYLTDEEEARLMAALPSDADRQRVLVLTQTGLRKSEFLGLRWRHVDLKAGVLTIPRSKNGEARHVPMTSAVRSVLSRLPRSLDASALVFPNSAGGSDLRWAEKTFPEAVRGAQIEDFRLHDLRHSFASRLAMEGVDLLTIKELGGWKTLAMVQRYAHLSPGHRQSAIERLVTRQRGAEIAQATGTE